MTEHRQRGRMQRSERRVRIGWAVSALELNEVIKNHYCHLYELDRWSWSDHLAGCAPTCPHTHTHSELEDNHKARAIKHTWRSDKISSTLILSAASVSGTLCMCVVSSCTVLLSSRGLIWVADLLMEDILGDPLFGTDLQRAVGGAVPRWPEAQSGSRPFIARPCLSSFSLHFLPSHYRWQSNKRPQMCLKDFKKGLFER